MATQSNSELQKQPEQVKSLPSVQSKRKQHYIDIGYHDPTIVYEIKLVKIAEIPAGTPLADIVGKLQHNGITNVLVDAGQPREVDMMRKLGLLAQRVRLLTPQADDAVSDLVATDNQSQDELLKSAPKTTNDKEEK